MISVCLATYNGESFVKEQLSSILSQLPEDAEVIIADDGSSDGTLAVIASLGDDRVRLLSRSRHLGPVYNFERAILAAKGDVVFLADQDDRWLPGKVSLMLTALEGKILAVHDANFMDAEGRELASLGTMWMKRPFKTGVFRNWYRNTYTGCCMVFCRELLAKALPFPQDLPMHDQWLGLMAERHFGSSCIAVVDKPLIQYRIHTKNATQLLGGKSRSLVQRLKWRLSLLRSLRR